jgi:hypothetical protein
MEKRLRSPYDGTAFAIAPDRFQQLPAGVSYLCHRAFKGFLIGLGGLLEAADLPHKLQRGRIEFLCRSGLRRITRSLNTSAHLVRRITPQLAQALSPANSSKAHS